MVPGSIGKPCSLRRRMSSATISTSIATVAPPTISKQWLNQLHRQRKRQQQQQHRHQRWRQQYRRQYKQKQRTHKTKIMFAKIQANEQTTNQSINQSRQHYSQQLQQQHQQLAKANERIQQQLIKHMKTSHQQPKLLRSEHKTQRTISWLPPSTTATSTTNSKNTNYPSEILIKKRFSSW